MLTRSPLGISVFLPRYYFFLKIVNILIEDLLQVIVAIATVSFVGKITTIWTVKISLSVTTFCYNHGKLTTHFVRLNFITNSWKKTNYQISKELPNLNVVNRDLRVANNTKLTKVNLANLQLGHSFYFQNNPNLLGLDFGKMFAFQNGLQVTDNDNLSELKLDAVITPEFETNVK